MRTSSALLERGTKVLRRLALLAVTSLLIGLLLVLPKAMIAQEKKTAEEAKFRKAWHDSMVKVPLPKKKGTFEVSYPNMEWKEVKSTKAPNIPFLPRRGPRPLIVGNGNDISARAPTGLISSAIGSFDSVTGVTSLTGKINNTGPEVANAYSIQLNTNFFASTDCAGSPNPGCLGWQQFVYSTDGTNGFAFIQYWLIRFNQACPAGAGWNQFSFPGDTDIYCFKNSAMTSAVPNQPFGNLANLSLTGTVSATGDSWIFSTGTTLFAGAGDNAVHAAAGWDTAEFCIVGNAGGGQANFNNGSQIVTRTKIIYGGTAAPNCTAQGFTGETNNLNFGPTAPGASPPGPAVIATLSSGGGAASNCAAATSVGDTHLTTFDGLMYDFQASGDFILAQTGPDFVVQARQVSGAPTWPNASLNHAVATQMGKTKVVIAVGPKLFIDGKAWDLGDGRSVYIADGVTIWRKGNIYFVTSQSGNSVRATVNSNYIDVLVGLDECCAKGKATGLLANAKGNVNQLVARNGTVLTNPFSFKELYYVYGDSWRIPPKVSLLSVLDEKVVVANPQKTFEVRDLDPKLYKSSLLAARDAGVKEGPLLDAAILDIAFFGTEKAAQVFVGAPPPVAVGKIK